MSNLVVMEFGQQHRAASVLEQLRLWNRNRGCDLDNAGVIDSDGAPTFRDGDRIAERLTNALSQPWRALMTAVLPLPAVSQSNRKDKVSVQELLQADCWRRLLESHNAVRDVAAMLQPSSSAVFALVQEDEGIEVLRRFTRILLQLPLDADAENQLRAFRVT